jgi:hypothetical protein
VTRWDDIRLDLSSVPLKTDDVELLNDLGEQGWELVAVTANAQAYFKKPVPESAPAVGPASAGNQAPAPAPRRPKPTSEVGS